MVLQVEGLSKSFGRRAAVRGVSFAMESGEVVALLGPNGAGKTTTMRMIAGFLEPDKGGVKIFGIDVALDRARALERIGYLPEGAPLYGEMTPLSYLRFIAEARGIDPKATRPLILRAAQDVLLGDAIDRPIDALSKGYRRRVGLAAALIHDPMLLVLDEPTDGLDPNQRDSVRALIKRLAQDRALIISTHVLEEVEAVCTRVILIDHGQVVIDSTPAALTAEYGSLAAAFRTLTKEEASA